MYFEQGVIKIRDNTELINRLKKLSEKYKDDPDAVDCIEKAIVEIEILPKIYQTLISTVTELEFLCAMDEEEKLGWGV